jgi:hypothetical protein
MSVRQRIEDEILRMDFKKKDDAAFTRLRTIHRFAIRHLPDLEHVTLQRMNPAADYWDPWLHALVLAGGKRRLSQATVRELISRAHSYEPGSEIFKLFSFALDRQEPPMGDLILDREMLRLARDAKPGLEAICLEVDNPYKFRDQFERYFCCLDLARSGILVVPSELLEPVSGKLAQMGYVGDLRERFVISTILWIPGAFSRHHADGNPLSPDPEWGANPERYWTFDLLREGGPLEFRTVVDMFYVLNGWPGATVITHWRRDGNTLRLNAIDITLLRKI